MNIAMIGFSRSGKTSYMAAMYDWFFRNSVEGFSITTESESASNALLSLAAEIKNGNYPPGTAIQDKYEFKLKFAGTDLTEFKWLDYRGGLLDAIANGTDQDVLEMNEYGELVKFVAASSALIVFLDSTSFTGRSGAAIEDQLRVVNALMQQVSATRDVNTMLPVSFVLTKLDKSVKKAGDLDEILLSHAGTTLRKLLEDVEKSNVLSALLTGTVVGPESLNITYPLLMSMCSALREECIRAKKEFDKANEECERFADKAGVWDDFKSAVKGEISYRELAIRRLNSAMQSAEKHDAIIPALKKLAAMLQAAVEDEKQFVYMF